MTTIKLKEFFYWYKADMSIEVAVEVAKELLADKQYESTHQWCMKRNKANYSLDAEDGIEKAACEFETSPAACLELMDQYRRLCCTLNSLPAVQGWRMYAHYLLGRSQTEIAVDEGMAVFDPTMSEIPPRSAAVLVLCSASPSPSIHLTAFA